MEMAAANPAGAAWTALAEMTTARPPAPAATPRLGEEFAQSFDGAAHALLGGVIGAAEGGADFAQGFVLEIAEQDGGAVGVIERVHGFVEQRFDASSSRSAAAFMVFISVATCSRNCRRDSRRTTSAAERRVTW